MNLNSTYLKEAVVELVQFFRVTLFVGRLCVHFSVSTHLEDMCFGISMKKRKKKIFFFCLTVKINALK